MPSTAPTTRPLPVIASVVERITSAKSARIVGTVYVMSSSHKRIPCQWECAFERPNKYRQKLAILGCDDEKASLYTICDGERYLTVDESGRTATTGAVLPMALDLHIEVLARETVPAFVGLNWGPSGFSAPRRDLLASAAADVFELKSEPFRVELWLSAADGRPLRAAQYLATDGKPELPEQVWDSISIDEPLDPGLFVLTPPAGFQKRQKDQSPEDVRTGWSSASLDARTGMRIECRFAFAIGDGDAVLLAWSLFDKSGHEAEATEAFTPTLARFSDESATPYRVARIGVTRLAGDRTLHWAVAAPDQKVPAATPRDDRRVWLALEGRPVGPSINPLRLDRAKLASTLEDLQRAVRDSRGVDDSFTLDVVEQKARSLSGSAR